MSTRGRSRWKVLSATVIIAGLAGAQAWTRNDHEDRATTLERAIEGGRAKNVILFLGDGMGDSEITIARNYQVGARGRVGMDSLPLTGAYTTYALQERNPALTDDVRVNLTNIREAIELSLENRSEEGWQLPAEYEIVRVAVGG